MSFLRWAGSISSKAHWRRPWLGHLMVSRQETARALLTPGEVMQLPSGEELVLVSGCPPIRARKARYYGDPELAARVLTAPAPTNARPPNTAIENGGPAGSQSSRPGKQVVITPAEHDDDDPANAGIRRDPELREPEEVVPKAREAMHEFEPRGENINDDAQRASFSRRGTRVARQASFGPTSWG